MPCAVAVADRDGVVAFANGAWNRLQHHFQWLRGDSQDQQDSPVFQEAAFREVCCGASEILSGFQNVVQGLQPEFSGEIHVTHSSQPFWFSLRVESLDCEGYTMLSLTDITPHRKIEQDLRESHSLFQRIVEGTGDGIFIYDLEGRLLMRNSVCNELFPAPSPNIIGEKIEKIFPPELVQFIESKNKMVLQTGRTIGYELVLSTPGGPRTLLVQKGLYRNHRNEIVGIIGISRDITERKLTEEKVERSERHFRALIEKSNDCIAILSAEGKLLYVSLPAQRMFGFEIEQWIGTNVFFWLHPEDVRPAQDRLQELLELPGASLALESRVLCKDGSWKWVETTASNLLEDSSVQAIILNIHDISRRKQTDRALQRFQAIVESSIDGILSIDPEGKITSWNSAAGRIFGYSEPEILGCNFDRLTPEDRLKESGGFSQAVLKGKVIKDVETVRLGRGGIRIEVALSLSPIRDRDGNVVGIAAIVRDITERRRLEKEVLEIADFEKHRIGQDLHDDLCQHLVGISMLSNILQNDLAQYGLKQAEDARQITEMVRNAVDHARILARGLSPLNFSQGGLMAGLETLVANTEQLFRMPCHFECHQAIHIENIEAATHLYRIAQEGLHNAVKHSRGTRVIVRLERSADVLELSVNDDGVGPPDSKPGSGGGGLGMHTMAYRARIIGAGLTIFRNAEGGSTVMCRFPLKENE